MIPDWNLAAVLPPVRPGAPGHSADRSPYIATLQEVVDRFATSAARIVILRGLLEYRAELRNRGIDAEFQWLNGSFMEDKEALINVPPNDVDVVTFFRLPANASQQDFLNQNGDLFDPPATKIAYHVDAYPYLIGRPLSLSDVRQISYWYSMWSHRRNWLWKGFVQVGMAADNDNAASDLLTQVEREMAAP
jgi:hypothetical protein